MSNTTMSLDGVKTTTYPNGDRYVIYPLPQHLRDKAVNLLKEELDDTDKQEIKKLYKEHGSNWPSVNRFHFAGGMMIRNLLRGTISDMQLPSNLWNGNDIRSWDHYYVAVLEMAVGIRTTDGFWGELVKDEESSNLYNG